MLPKIDLILAVLVLCLHFLHTKAKTDLSRFEEEQDSWIWQLRQAQARALLIVYTNS